MTTYWSKTKTKTGAREPNYMCFKKGCGSCRKSIRRDRSEGEFETVLKTLTPACTLLDMAKDMFARVWEQRHAQSQAETATLRARTKELDGQTAQLVDRIADASSETVVVAYEARIEKLARKKLAIAEKLQNTVGSQRPFGEVFELALGLSRF
ncbi:MAG: hypothetical protein AAGM38_10550 [Pseudomonadota bacterium]